MFQFLVAFAKLGKATVSFAMSIRPPKWNNTAPTGLIILKSDILVFFKNMSRKFNFHMTVHH